MLVVKMHRCMLEMVFLKQIYDVEYFPKSDALMSLEYMSEYDNFSDRFLFLCKCSFAVNITQKKKEARSPHSVC